MKKQNSLVTPSNQKSNRRFLLAAGLLAALGITSLASADAKVDQQIPPQTYKCSDKTLTCRIEIQKDGKQFNVVGQDATLKPVVFHKDVQAPAGLYVSPDFESTSGSVTVSFTKTKPKRAKVSG